MTSRLKIDILTTKVRCKTNIMDMKDNKAAVI
jgi:hypothetical protein